MCEVRGREMRAWRGCRGGVRVVLGALMVRAPRIAGLLSTLGRGGADGMRTEFDGMRTESGCECECECECERRRAFRNPR